MDFSFGGPDRPRVCKHLYYDINVGSTSSMWLISLVISDPGLHITTKTRFSAELEGQSIGRTRDSSSTSDPTRLRRTEGWPQSCQNGQIHGMAVKATAAQTRSSGMPTRKKSRKR